MQIRVPISGAREPVSMATLQQTAEVAAGQQVAQLRGSFSIWLLMVIMILTVMMCNLQRKKKRWAFGRISSCKRM
jgi:hypothetical protein